LNSLESLSSSQKRIKEVENYVRADLPLLLIKVPSEAYFVSEFVYTCSYNILRDFNIYQWDCAEGIKRLEVVEDRRIFKPVSRNEVEKIIEDVFDPMDPVSFLKWINRKVEMDFGNPDYKPSLFFVHNLHLFMEQPNVIQYIKNLKEKFLSFPVPSVIALLSSRGEISTELSSDFVHINMEKFYRSRESILEFLNDYLEEKELSLTQEEVDKIVENSVGLNVFECEIIYSISLQKKGKLDPDDVLKEKINLINKYPFLEYIRHSVREEDVGGLVNFKRWINRRKILFKGESRQDFKPPKGVLMLGVPGTGKSLSAKYVSSVLDIPLIRVDIGQIFSKWVGETEERLEKMISVVESIGACVLWFDEIEKSLAPKSHSGDSGVSKRVFSRLLTWFQEKKTPVFLFATANRIEDLPPEFTRKGRFDEIFFVDIPNKEERKQIFKVYAKNAFSEEELDYIASISEGFVGSDIEYIVEEAKLISFEENIPLTVELMEQIMREMPRSTDNLDIQQIRRMCVGRYKPASLS